jgi:hypothetical protein
MMTTTNDAASDLTKVGKEALQSEAPAIGGETGLRETLMTHSLNIVFSWESLLSNP